MIDVSALQQNEPMDVDVKLMVELPEMPGITGNPAEVTFKGFLTKDGGRFVLEGVMNANIPAFCAVCLTELGYAMSYPVREVFTRKPVDIDDWPVPDNTIDLASVFRDNILAILPGRIVCGKDCKPDAIYRNSSEIN